MLSVTVKTCDNSTLINIWLLYLNGTKRTLNLRMLPVRNTSDWNLIIVQHSNGYSSK